MIARKLLSDKIPKLTIDQFVQEATMGKMGADLLTEAKKVASLRHIGIKKTKLISTSETRAIQEAKVIETVPSPVEEEGENEVAEEPPSESLQ
jgi:small subunit ribosomal protein S3Ae